MSSTFLIRLPNWLGDVIMSLPVIRAIAHENPSITLLGSQLFSPLLAQLLPSLTYQSLPAKTSGYYRHFWHQRHHFTHALLFANSQRADLEAFLLRAKYRYGLSWKGRPRYLLNHRYSINHPEADGKRHQTQMWADFTTHFGLHHGIDFSPFKLTYTRKNHLVLIAGSENNPEKRWPIAHWRTFITQIIENSDNKIILSGTTKDREITEKIVQNFPSERVENLAGKTTLNEFLIQVASAQAVVGNDTGGLHLANAVGTPTIGLYGPTNPQRTRPIFDAPCVVIKPSAHNVGDMAMIYPDMVIKALKNLTTSQDNTG